MANPNKSPMKGFIKELAKAPNKPATKTSFTYAKRLTPENLNAMATPKRLSDYKSVREPKSNVVKEVAQHVKNRGNK